MATPTISAAALFPALTLKFAEDSKLQGAVKLAIDELTKARGKPPVFRLAIIDLADESSSGTLKYGAYNGDTFDFIASEAKIIALYAAFALRDLVEKYSAMMDLGALIRKGSHTLAGRKPPPEPGLIDALRANIDKAILNAADSRLSVIPRKDLLPKYEDIFNFPARGGLQFSGPFINALEQMIVPSSNPAASTVIMSVGFAYISGAMKAANLFVGGKGPWLSADFAGNYYPLMNTANDNYVGQAGTALSLAKLMAIIATGGVAMRGNYFNEMRMLLHAAVHGDDTPFLTRRTGYFDDPSDRDPSKGPLRIPKNKITHIKLGKAELKLSNGGASVGSEVWRLKGLYKSNKVYALSFQNLDWRFTSAEDLAWAIRRAIVEYEK